MKISYNWLMSYIDLSQSKYGVPTPEQLASRLDEVGIQIENVSYLYAKDGKVSKDDVVIDFKPTRELNSLCGMMWFANEVAGFYGVYLDSYETYGGHLPNDKWSRILLDKSTLQLTSTTKKCKLIAGRVIKSVIAHESPTFIKDAMYANGIEPSNSLTDSVWYAERNIGQPLIAIDANKVNERNFVVEESECCGIITYNGSKYNYQKGDIIIRCGSKVVNVAGVMTDDSVVATADTTSLIVISAYIDAISALDFMNRSGCITFEGILTSNDLRHQSILKALYNVTSLIYEYANGKGFEPLDSFTKLVFSKYILSTTTRKVDVMLSATFTYADVVKAVVNNHTSIFCGGKVNVNGKMINVNICEPSPFVGLDDRISSKFGSYRSRRQPCDLAQSVLSIYGCDYLK